MTGAPRTKPASPSAADAKARRGRDDVNALADAETSADALRRVYEARRAADPKRSLAFYCRKVGLTSTGHLSDVLKGRRRLTPAYRGPLLQALGIRGEGARLLRLLFKLEDEKDERRRRHWARRVALQRKVLRMTVLDAPSDEENLFLTLEVFCAFGLFGGTPRWADLVGYFGAARAADVAEAVAALQAMGLVREEGEGAYRSLTDHFVVREGAPKIAPVAFLKHALEHAAASLDTWFPRPGSAIFTSHVLSVSREAYESALEGLRHRLMREQAALERPSGADTLVRFSVQVYPLKDE